MRTWECLGKLAVLSVLGGLVLAGIMFPAVGAVGAISNRMTEQVDSISAELVNTDPPLMTTITDRDGAPIAYLYDQYRVLTPADKISQNVKDALVAVEDRRFYEHAGVDWLGTVRAAVTNQASGSVSQGASTLTQQYVKNYLVHVLARNNKADQQAAQEQTFARKAREAVDRLPESYRAAFVLRDLEELPTAEVAEVLGIEPAAVRQRVHRARLLLRGYLNALAGARP